MEEVFTYKNGKSFISYVILEDNIVCMSAHIENDKYNISFLKKILKTFYMFNEVITCFPYDYLVDFYSKHFEVNLINEQYKLYKVKKKGV